MAKKKTSNRKHKFKYAEPTTGVTAAVSAASAPAAATSATPARAAIGLPTRDFSYVSHDIRRVSIFAVSLIILELILWYVLGNSGLGKAVYDLISV